MSNRVEELEAKVSELQAAVDGLTEELVETKERVRQLESQVEVDVETAPSSPGANRSAEDETTPDVGSEVVDGEPASDGSKAEESEGSNDETESESESDGSDIIVA
ncbi:hypothetical protein ACFO0N_02000 [Halobium salinum]|uniref:BZIP transcription factor n=1 Tax=Halobium salinum TaxID=1364940 RepID=A0ABD5P7I9_9EURY|nr:chromosome segregation protein SMC [Halobium salinum]